MNTIIILPYVYQAYDWSIAVRDCDLNSVINLTLLKRENL